MGSRFEYSASPSTRPSRAARGPRVEYTFDEATDLVGHMKLRLHVATEQGDDMDLFIAIQKIDESGALVPFTFYAQFEDGPVALGWLRGLASRARSSPQHGVSACARAQARAQTAPRRNCTGRYRDMAVGYGIRCR